MSHLARLRPVALLCDADGNLFPSEEPAFEASIVVTADFLADHGVIASLDAHQLRRATTGKNFRSTATSLAEQYGAVVSPDSLERWVLTEREVVTSHLASVLHPDPAVVGPLSRLASDYLLAAVSSSASARLTACFTATGLDTLIPGDRRFSAEDSLPSPVSKPDPAIYLHACASLGLDPSDALAIEDSVPGVRSAVRAGIPTVGNVQFVPLDERDQRAAELTDAGVVTVISAWADLEAILNRARAPAPDLVQQ